MKVYFANWERAGLATLVAIILAFTSLSVGQQLTGTLSGTTTDATGAVVPNANIEMKNELSGDTRTTVSNDSGYFTLTAVQPGTYTVTVTAQGFKSWVQSSIVFAQGDNRKLPNISLQVGAATEVITIAAGELAVPTDTAEVSSTVNEHLITDLPLANRNAGELIKLMPGVAFANGQSQGSGFNTKTISTATGPAGSFSVNGTQPNGAMAYMLDGANLIDPGNAGSQIANINQDMISEVKFLMSSYSAEYAKGPTIFQAFSKSGGTKYHGVGYLYARNSALNAIDAYTHSQIANGATTEAAAAPSESFYYIGGNVGGPVPFLNKGRQKLFFWGGYEYMKQSPAGNIINYNVPTAEQRLGHFDYATINGVPGDTIVEPGKTLQQKLFDVWQYSYRDMCCNRPVGSTNTNLPTGLFDVNGVAFMGLIPTSNIQPSAGNGWNNYQFVSQVPQNRWEATGKVDYAIGDNTKLTGSYTRQIETDQHPVGIWWTPAWTLPYPGGANANTTSQEIMVNFTHAFSPTMTNEAVFTLARFINPIKSGNPDAIDRNKLGMNITGLFGVTTKQIPNILGPWGGAFPDIANMNLNGPFAGGGFGAEKRDPAFYDNLTKVVGNHTIKVGFYWDQNSNIQSSSAFPNPPAGGANGTYQLGWGANSTGNVVADFLLGRAASYNQPSKDLVFNIRNHQWSVYGQDSFKISRQLTVNYGLRLDHLGQWFGPENGMAVWDPASYVNGTPLNRFTADNTGLLWHSVDSSIPMSGWKSPLFYFAPRAGLAYDVFGNGKTVVRGGFAAFRYQVSVNNVTGPTSLASGIFNAQDTSITGGYSTAGFTPPSAVAANGSTISAFQRGDNKTPYTNDWNITVSQALPWRSVFEISYVGNKSGNMILDGNNGKIGDANAIQPSTYYLPDPVNGLYQSPGRLSCANGDATDALDCFNPGPNGGTRAQNYNAAFTQNHWRPLTNYQDIYVISHGSYANYNSLQMAFQKQAGAIQFMTNYTFSKVMGTRDGQSSNGATTGFLINPFDLKSNYGPLAYDHTQIVNFSYVWNLPSKFHDNAFLKMALNGWQLSGYTTYQSGAPLQPNLGGNLNAQLPGALTVPTVGIPDAPDNSILLPNGLKSIQVNAGTWYGTDQTGGGYETFPLLLTCDPRKHASGLYFNPDCFTTPAFGQMGTVVWPYLHLPAYFNSDLALYKSFKITERQSVQFRISANNFLNHPLPQFGLAGNSDQSLSFIQTTPMTIDDQQVNVQSLARTNTNTTTTGKPAFKTGQRTLLFALKYYF